MKKCDVLSKFMIERIRPTIILNKGDGKELASRLWNVTTKSTFEAAMCDSRNEFVVAFDVGIAGHVAATKEPINVTNAYEVTIRGDFQDG